MKVKVVKVFRDKYTKVWYAVGQELDIQNEARINDLVSRGLIEIEEEKKISDSRMLTVFDKEFERRTVIEALKSIGERTSWNMKDETIITNISALDEEKVTALKIALRFEE